jgi:cytochrome bd-type quinol oxidase subunit 1
MGARDSVLVSLLIKLLLGVANGLVWAVMLACLFKPQLWMALGPIIGSVLALKGAAP